MNKQLNDLIFIFIGNILMAFGYAWLLVPNGIVTGGVTGISMILSRWTLFNEVFYTNLVTIILLILCLLFLGKEYFLKSLFGGVTYMFLFAAFRAFPLQPITVAWLAVPVAALVIGIAYYLCISHHGTNVSVDIIALIINHRYPQVSIAKAMRLLSIIILLFGLLSYGWYSILLGIVFTVLQTSIFDYLYQKHRK